MSSNCLGSSGDFSATFASKAARLKSEEGFETLPSGWLAETDLGMAPEDFRAVAPELFIGSNLFSGAIDYTKLLTIIVCAVLHAHG